MKIWTIEYRRKLYEDAETADIPIGEIESQTIQFFATRELAHKYLEEYLKTWVKKDYRIDYYGASFKDDFGEYDYTISYIEPISSEDEF